jgi:hypothetical protein
MFDECCNRVMGLVAIDNNRDAPARGNCESENENIT